MIRLRRGWFSRFALMVGFLTLLFGGAGPLAADDAHAGGAIISAGSLMCTACADCHHGNDGIGGDACAAACSLQGTVTQMQAPENPEIAAGVLPEMARSLVGRGTGPEPDPPRSVTRA